MGCGEVPDSRGTTRMRFLLLVLGATRNCIARSLKLSKATGREHKKEPLELAANPQMPTRAESFLSRRFFLKPVQGRAEYVLLPGSQSLVQRGPWLHVAKEPDSFSELCQAGGPLPPLCVNKKLLSLMRFELCLRNTSGTHLLLDPVWRQSHYLLAEGEMLLSV